MEYLNIYVEHEQVVVQVVNAAQAINISVIEIANVLVTESTNDQ